MKKLMMVAMLLGMAGTAAAYEIEGNPDRKLSFGIHFDHGWNSSDFSFGSFKISEFSKAKTNAFQLDARIPMNQIFTLSIRGGFSGSTVDGWMGDKIEQSDRSIGISVRAYLP